MRKLIFAVFWWLRRGRAYLKSQITLRVSLNPVDWPYRPEVLDLLRQERAKGRELVLATGAAALVSACVILFWVLSTHNTKIS